MNIEPDTQKNRGSTTIASVLVQTGRNLRQTWGSQLMTLLTVSLSVLIFSFFFLVYLNLQKAGVKLGEQIRVIVFMEEDVPAAARPALEQKIKAFGKIEKIVFNTRHDAFTHLQARLGNDSDILADLSADFLPPSIEVYPKKDLKSLARISGLADFLSTLPGAVKVKYGRNWIERLGYFTQLVRVIVMMSGGLLVLTATFMVSSTIRLTVVSRQAELEILRLLGASKGYIQAPLMLEGILQGVIGSGLGVVSLYALYSWIGSTFRPDAVTSFLDFTFMPLPVVSAIFAASILLCSVGSMISIRKFLRL